MLLGQKDTGCDGWLGMVGWTTISWLGGDQAVCSGPGDFSVF
jgi:hypothetical protein